MKLPALSPLSPLSSILTDIRRAIDAQLYYPALLVALTVSEICSALTLHNSMFVKQKHYVDFVDKYAAPKSLGCDGLTCYRLRGGVVHRANFAGHALFSATNVIFTIPESQITFHAITLVVGEEKRAPVFDLVMFCTAMIDAAHAWYEDHQNEPIVESNMKNLIRYCADGLAPFVVGQPLVASGD